MLKYRKNPQLVVSPGIACSCIQKYICASSLSGDTADKGSRLTINWNYTNKTSPLLFFSSTLFFSTSTLSLHISLSLTHTLSLTLSYSTYPCDGLVGSRIVSIGFLPLRPPLRPMLTETISQAFVNTALKLSACSNHEAYARWIFAAGWAAVAWYAVVALVCLIGCVSM